MTNTARSLQLAYVLAACASRISPICFSGSLKKMAALDKSGEEEVVAKTVIGSTEVQNKARVVRSEYRKVLGTEYIRELILK